MIINSNTINELIDTLGEETASELTALYFETTPEIINNILTAVNNNESEDLRFWGHRLKGSSGTLGFEDMQNLGKKIEVIGTSSTVDGALADAEELSPMLNSIKKLLNMEFPSIKV